MKKVPYGFHPLSKVTRTKYTTRIVEPKLIATDTIPGKGYCAYLVAGNETWGYKKFKSIEAANKYAKKIAAKHKLKISLLE